MTEQEGIQKLFEQGGEELAEMLRRGRRFTEEILGENEKLRVQILRSESERMRLESALVAGGSALQEENSQLKARVEFLEARFGKIEAENQDFAARYAEISEENESLASLYVAAYQLHTSLEMREVLSSPLQQSGLTLSVQAAMMCGPCWPCF